MIIHSNYSRLSDKELLNELIEAAHHSPIIAELCKRIESNEERNVVIENLFDYADKKIACPVCKSNLQLNLDEDKIVFFLEIQKG